VLYTPLVERDWGVQQVLASANWGGVVGNFFTGGLNLQVQAQPQRDAQQPGSITSVCSNMTLHCWFADRG
jgi:hypothetical protein